MNYIDLGLTEEHFNFLMALSGIFFALTINLTVIKLFLKN